MTTKNKQRQEQEQKQKQKQKQIPSTPTSKERWLGTLACGNDKPENNSSGNSNSNSNGGSECDRRQNKDLVPGGFQTGFSPGGIH